MAEVTTLSELEVAAMAFCSAMGSAPADCGQAMTAATDAAAGLKGATTAARLGAVRVLGELCGACALCPRGLGRDHRASSSTPITSSAENGIPSSRARAIIAAWCLAGINPPCFAHFQTAQVERSHLAAIRLAPRRRTALAAGVSFSIVDHSSRRYVHDTAELIWKNDQEAGAEDLSMLAAMDLSEIPTRLERMNRRQSELARHLNLDPSSLSKTIKGRRKLTADELIKLEEFFGESITAPTGRRAFEGRGATSRRIPVFGYAAAGGEDRIAIASDQVLDWIDAPPFWNGVGDLMAVRIAGESMEPRYYAGERVPVRRGVPPARGGDCLVELTDDTALLKVFRGMRDGVLFLGQYNPGEHEIRIPVTQVRAIHAAGLPALL